MRPEDSFAAKKSSAVELPATLDSLPSFLDQSRFNEYNNKTLGFVVVNAQLPYLQIQSLGN